MAVRAGNSCRVHTTPVGNCLACQGLNLPRGGSAGGAAGGAAGARPTRAATRTPVVRLVPSEHDEQAAFIDWTRAELAAGRHPELDELFAVPNFSGRMGQLTARQSALLNAEGRRKGVEDLMLLVPRGHYHGLLLETKRIDATPSDVRPAQRWWHEVHRRRGFRVEVCKGAEALKAATLAYLALPDVPERRTA